MINKIKSYVEYVLKVNKIDDKEMFEEIVANLIEKYHHYLDEGLTEDKAYVETIKTIGDFNIKEEVIDDKYEYRPNWANISLWISLGLAVLSTLSLFLSVSVSIVLIAISISLHIGSSYYLYHLSQYVLKEEKDIAKHNNLLKTIFTNLKTTFIFWNINLSYWISLIINRLLAPFITLNGGVITDYRDLVLIYFFYVFVFLISFIVLFIIFRSIYLIIEKKYFDLTKEDNLDNLISRSGLFKSSINPKVFAWLIFIFGFAVIFQFNRTLFSSPSHSQESYVTIFNSLFPKNIAFFIILFFLAAAFITSIFSLIRPKNNLKLIISTLALYLISDLLILYYLLYGASSVGFDVTVYYSFFNTIKMGVLIIAIIWSIVYYVKKKERKG